MLLVNFTKDIIENLQQLLAGLRIKGDEVVILVVRLLLELGHNVFQLVTHVATVSDVATVECEHSIVTTLRLSVTVSP